MKLTGKTAWFWLDGHRSGRIVRVDQGKRSGVRSLTVKLPNGRRKRIDPRACPHARRSSLGSRNSPV